MKHIHHLKPKYLGGTDDPENLIDVTLDEHITIHYARWIAYHNWRDKLAYMGLMKLVSREDIVKEAQRLGGREGGKKSIALGYGRRFKKGNLSRTGMTGPGTFLGRKHTEETKKKMSQSAKGRTPWNKGKKWISAGVWE